MVYFNRWLDMSKRVSPEIRVILSLEEKEKIKKKADKAGLSMSAYLRMLGLKAK